MVGVAYCRVSTDLAEQKKSLNEQRKEWQEFFIDNHEGVKPAKCGYYCRVNGSTRRRTDGIYVDEGISGKSLKNRKAFNQMIEDAKKGKFNYIYVEDTSRFSRCTEDGIKIIKDLREYGILVFFRKEGWFCTSDKDFEYTLRVSIAQEEIQKLSQRLQWSMERLHKKGGWNSGAPFGYNIVEGYLQINEEEAEVVRTIFDLYANQKWGIGKIARYLNENNITTKKGVKWSQTQIGRMLESPLYTGEQHTHTVQTIDVTRDIRQIIPKEEHIIHNFEHLRIIDDETFKNAIIQHNRQREIHKAGNYNTCRYPLSQVLYCKHCGGSYKRKKRHTYCRKDGTSKDIGYEWTCQINDMYGKSRCNHRKGIPEADVFNAIKRELRAKQNENLDELFEYYIQKTIGKCDVDIEQVQRQILRIKNAQQQLRYDFTDKLVDRSIYKESMYEYTKKLQSLYAEVERYKNKENIIEETRLQYDEYKKMIKELDVNNLDNTTLKTIFRKIFVYIKVIDGKKCPYFCFIYNFMDTTDEELIGEQLTEGNWTMWYPVYE